MCSFRLPATWPRPRPEPRASAEPLLGGRGASFHAGVCSPAWSRHRPGAARARARPSSETGSAPRARLCARVTAPVGHVSRVICRGDTRRFQNAGICRGLTPPPLRPFSDTHTHTYHPNAHSHTHTCTHPSAVSHTHASYKCPFTHAHAPKCPFSPTHASYKCPFMHAHTPKCPFSHKRIIQVPIHIYTPPPHAHSRACTASKCPFIYIHPPKCLFSHTHTHVPSPIHTRTQIIQEPVPFQFSTEQSSIIVSTKIHGL